MPNVAPATRERVAQAAAELSYVASPAASRLASGRTSSVGVVVPFASRWFFAQVVVGAAEVLRSAGYDLLLYQLGDEDGREQFFERLPLHRRVDGALLIDVALQPDEQARLQSLGIPIAVVGGAATGVGAVGTDEAAGVELAVRHLSDLGHRSMGMLCGRPADGLRFVVPDQRRVAFLEATERLSVRTDPSWVVTTQWGIEGGAQAMETLLAEASRPTAVFAESDEIAFGALRTIRRAGLAVPGDISLVGFDDHELASVVDLTTVAQPVTDLGAAAASLLVDALDGEADPFARVVLPTSLVVRGSTAPPR
jgi:DNA-binding LacI/PurR family transcriptional regulator